MSDLEVFPLSLPGGINQSAPVPDETDLEELKNFAIFRGRTGLRAPLALIATLEDDQGTPAEVTAILDIVDHEGKLWVASYSATTDKVYLHDMEVDGTDANTTKRVVHTSVASKPVITLLSVDGGQTTTGESRLYVVDYNQNLDTKYWDGSAIQTLSEDLDVDDSAENIQFSLMAHYKSRAFGTGFLEGTTTRGEILRYSQVGLEPTTDDAGGTPSSKEWHTADFTLIGRRGDPIVALSKAGDYLLVFQKRALNAFYGSGPSTFTVQEVSDVIGAVGPHAVTNIDERIVYFWASDGPYRTDGNQLEYIGQPIRQLVTEVDSEELHTRVGYSPDDGMVYFIVSPGGEDSYHLALAFDHRRERWMKTVWFVGASTEAEFGAVAFLDSVAAPGPEAAPSGLSATAQGSSQVGLSWTNGDVNVNTETHVYRSTSMGFSPSDGSNLVATLAPGVNSYSDTSLGEQTTYYYQVRHFRNNTHSSNSGEASDTTWCNAPSGISLRGLTSGIEISGTNNASGADIEIERSDDGSTGWANVTTLSAPGGSFSYDDTGLTCGQTYYYRVKASKVGETDSAYTSVSNWQACDATAVPSAPSSLVATASGETQIDLTWTDNADDEDEYEVHRSTDGGSTYSLLATKSANTTSHSDTGLSTNTEYYYKVRAVNDEGNSNFSNVDNATTGRDLDAPSSLQVTAFDTNSIDLSWTDNSADENQFEIHRDSGSGFALHDTVGANVTTYSDTGLSQGTEYSYKVRAVGGGESGPFSNVVTQTTDTDPPSAITDLTATKDGTNPETEIDLSWTDATGETSYDVYRKTTGAFTRIAQGLAAGTTSYADTGLSSNTIYTYKVTAINAGGSTDSNEATETTDSFTSAPSAPSGLTAVAQSVDQIDLSWTDNSSGTEQEDEFRIYRCTGGTGACDWPGEYTQIATVGTDVTTYSDTGLSSNTTYSYVVTAWNSEGESAGSNEADDTTDPDAPAAPSGLTVTTDSTSQLTVDWTDNASTETGYEIQISLNGTSWSNEDIGLAANTVQYVDTGLDDNEQYYYRVRAKNATGASAWSNADSAYTDIDAPSSLTATQGAGASSDDTINLSWSMTGVGDGDADTGVEVHRSTDGGSTYSLHSTEAAGSTSFSDTGLPDSTEFYYKVRAIGQNGTSAFSNADNASTSAEADPPAAPSGLGYTLDKVDSGVDELPGVTLTWTDNSDNEANFRIQRSTDGGTNWFTEATPGENVTSYFKNNMSHNTSYMFRVRAENGAGNSAWSNTVSFTTEQVLGLTSLTVTDTSFCDGSIATPEIELTWVYGDIDDLTQIRILRSPANSPSGTYSEVDTLTSNLASTTSYEDTDFHFFNDWGNTYYYRLELTFSGPENTATITQFAKGDDGATPNEPDCS